MTEPTDTIDLVARVAALERLIGRLLVATGEGFVAGGGSAPAVEHHAAAPFSWSQNATEAAP